MPLQEFLEWIQDAQRQAWEVAHHEILPRTPPSFESIPPELHVTTARLIHEQGIKALYSHQAAGIRMSLEGKDVILSTNTASGKSLCYQAPILDCLFQDPKARALMIFPMKALERDQRDSFTALAGRSPLTAAVYDGDTPPYSREKLRNNPPHVLITNPDMLHFAILAYHEKWKEFFSHLKHIVLDEVHVYKGIFGSHVAQLMWRLLRVCEKYGSHPQFTACSATVANPHELVKRLTGRDFCVISESGAGSAERHFLFLRPALSSYTVAAKLFTKSIDEGLKTIVFTQARKITELITTWVIQQAPHLRNRISSYRAGFLPEERREIEERLFSGRMVGVISCSALEMGIDVGGLDLCILVGYPGTVINTWQRGGRVGRNSRASAVILIAGNDALDQYFIRNPGDFFGRTCEEAVLDPLNAEVLKKHIPCAAAEMPLTRSEVSAAPPEMHGIIDELHELGALYEGEDGNLYSSRRRPHLGVDLRGIGESFSIFLEEEKTLLGKSNGVRALLECHEGAVYLHRARQYVVTKLDLVKRNILVRPANLSYYTRAISEKETEILGSPIRGKDFPGFSVREARLKVTQTIVGYEKRKTMGQELIGTVELSLPPIHFETVGIWIEIPETVREVVERQGLHFMGGIHALEHAAIAMFPLFALCDRDDIGGISTTHHEQVCKPAVFIYDGHPGGVGLAHKAFEVISDLLEKARKMVAACPCEDGCPSCIHSPKCGSGNKPLDKKACLKTLDLLLDKNGAPAMTSEDSTQKVVQRRPAVKAKKSSTPRSLVIPELAMRKKKVVVFDLETQKLAQEVGGWRNVSQMRLSLGVAYTEEDGFTTYTEETVGKLIELLQSSDLIVGFNHVRFDYEVLRAYTNEDLRRLPNLDILQEVEDRLGHRLNLDHLAEHTLGIRKSGSGLEAIRWYREGRMDLLEKYCTHDVRITRDLYRFGLENGFLRYQNRAGRLGKIPVKW
jgi:DEAD/DEAH box helicase domain-containing protein